MGGDHAPRAQVEAVLQAASAWTDTQFVLVGQAEKLKPHLAGGVPANVTVEDAPEVIEADDEPVRAVRRKTGSSMVTAGRMVKEGAADAMISAGNTGALMATGLLVVGRLPGIERPGLTAMMPTIDEKGVLALDLGANMDAKPEHLLQYAIMGSLYRQKTHGIAKPRVGLLNVGTEAGKGNELTKAAFELFEKAPIHFVGNVESRDVLFGVCDVLVCDGFSGNVMLKAIEGTADILFKVLKKELTSSWKFKIGAAILKPGFGRVKRKLDYNEYNGAPLLGLNGLVVKAHGSSDVRAMVTAIRQARTAVTGGLIAAIQGEISGKRENL
jgi:glycerol-3-phosphate acyltransferase PlsX